MKTFILLILSSAACLAQTVRIPSIDFAPGKYVCYYTETPLLINGVLDEPAWSASEWTDNFTDIKGAAGSAPKFRTRAKMLWDDAYFYLAAELEETDIWGSLQTRDDTVYNDNAFEIFIDPDGDTHDYCEIEINSLNTIWDLLLLKPYRDKINAGISAWDIKEFKSAIHVYGTLNKPGDKDSCWIVESAIPWKIFNELTEAPAPPKNGDQWRVDFLRVEWKPDTADGKYKKERNPLNNKICSPNYWVWSPLGLVNMHYPEMWGYVQFSGHIAGRQKTEFVNKPEETAKWFLRRLYYAERIYFNENGSFTDDLLKLNIKEQEIPGFMWPPIIEHTSASFEASLKSDDNSIRVNIRNDGLFWVSNINQ
ncbi:MAG TPA: carbohydrate-binding family 9-like protein [Ignavibacteriales bacterium]|nr:carbohydrate-binding family 9-like protein [Ignavibacteriales bacterium]